MVLSEARRDVGSEQSLVAAARLGDPDAFEALVEPLRRRLHLLHDLKTLGGGLRRARDKSREIAARPRQAFYQSKLH